MTLSLSTGKTFQICWLGKSQIFDNIVMEMYDVRPMHEIAADFHGLEGYTVTDDEGVRTFTDYNTLQNIARKVGGIVEITMEKASALEA